PFGRMVGQRAFAGGFGNAKQVRVWQRKSFNDVLGSVHAKNLLPGSEKHVHAIPAITHDRDTAGRSLEEPSGWAVSILRHDSASDVESGSRGAEKGWMEVWREMRYEND